MWAFHWTVKPPQGKTPRLHPSIGPHGERCDYSKRVKLWVNFQIVVSKLCFPAPETRFSTAEPGEELILILNQNSLWSAKVYVRFLILLPKWLKLYRVSFSLLQNWKLSCSTFVPPPGFLASQPGLDKFLVLTLKALIRAVLEQDLPPPPPKWGIFRSSRIEIGGFQMWAKNWDKNFAVVHLAVTGRPNEPPTPSRENFCNNSNLPKLLQI